MANKRSALKAARQAEKRGARNKPIRSAVKTYVKKATLAIRGTEDGAAESVRQAVSQLDRAARKGVIHRNAAARRKSRLMARLHQLSLALTATSGDSESTGATPSAAPTAAKVAPPRTAAKATKAAPVKAKAPSAKASAPKTAAPKAPAAKAPSTKAPSTKAPSTKAPTARRSTAKASPDA